ncbi:hypothetical protein QF023_000114 [Chryseobacterium sp. SLBN-27]|uniref:endonuclease NucS domain-containing protein n=1 Tax=Chryseobacterium sp. SLBN-27 TaxID=3042287 RepID=UPI002861614F|nr:endonuclease NucS domain-containing protein [Chryseobacterium sp. SLBN-27]MDR6156598.1 hypothetical protein [Chryseobacterium sp. SLBN-27]
MAKQVEHHIRDWLVNHPEFIEKGLQVIDKEHYLPDSIGSNGFIDILCKDIYNNFVIIEIKRSDPAARQAFTEVFKYAELIQNNYNARNSEIRIIIVSTHWDQMIRAFSHLCFKSNFSLTGLQIFIDEESKTPVAKEEISPISSRTFSRKFMSSQIIYLFCEQEKRTKAHQVVSKKLDGANFSDYVTVDLDSPNERGFYTYALSVAFQRFTYIELLKFITDLKGEKFLELDENEFETEEEYLHDLEQTFLLSLDMTKHIDSLESSSAEKFESVTGIQNWKIRSLKKYGIFKSDPRYNDELLMKELKGHDGTSSNKFVAFSASDQKERIQEIFTECQFCLSHTPQWQLFISFILSQLISSKEKYKIIVDIYNPDSIVTAFYFALNKGNLDYLPTFLIIIDFPDTKNTEFYCGQINSNGIKPKLSMFNSDEMFDLHLFPENETVAKKMGLIYSIRKTVFIETLETSNKFVVLKKDKVHHLNKQYPSIEEYIISNKMAVSKMIKEFSTLYSEF